MDNASISSSSSLSSPPLEELDTRLISSFSLTLISFPMPIPKLGILCTVGGRFPPDMNLMLPTCTSSPSCRSKTSCSISCRRSRIIRVVGRFVGSVLTHSRQRRRKSGGHSGQARFRASVASIPKLGGCRLKCVSSASLRAAISQKIIPSEKTSVGRSNPSPSRISGDI